MRHKSDKHRLGGAEIKCVCVWGRINFDLLKCVGGLTVISAKSCWPHIRINLFLFKCFKISKRNKRPAKITPRSLEILQEFEVDFLGLNKKNGGHFSGLFFFRLLYQMLLALSDRLFFQRCPNRSYLASFFLFGMHMWLVWQGIA